MIIGACMTLAVLGFQTPPIRPAHQRSKRPAASVQRFPLDSSDLYSLRARRRFASYLRLRLLELREANLERAAAVIERRLPFASLQGGSVNADPSALRGIAQP